MMYEILQKCNKIKQKMHFTCHLTVGGLNGVFLPCGGPNAIVLPAPDGSAGKNGITLLPPASALKKFANRLAFFNK